MTLRIDNPFVLAATGFAVTAALLAAGGNAADTFRADTRPGDGGRMERMIGKNPSFEAPRSRAMRLEPAGGR